MNAALEPAEEADVLLAVDEPLRLEAGGLLQPLTLRYARYGEWNRRRDNVVLVCHALSGSARAADWWPELFGAGGVFDLERQCVLCVNVLGSCYGSTGPASLNPRTGRPYGPDFPLVSIHDMVRSQALLLDHLGIERLRAVVGGSIGGLQALSWAVQFPERVERCVAVGACPLGAMALAQSHLQRQAIRSDPAWRGGWYPPDEPPVAGLALARGIAMCTYKSEQLFQERYGRRPNRRGGEDPQRSLAERFDVAGYLDYQGEIFVRRFDANCYLAITKAMDNFSLGETAEEEEASFRRLRARVLLVGITSDWLFPPGDVQALATRMRAAGVEVRYEEMVSAHGHDSFLAEAGQLATLLAGFLTEAESVSVQVG